VGLDSADSRESKGLRITFGDASKRFHRASRRNEGGRIMSYRHLRRMMNVGHKEWAAPYVTEIIILWRFWRVYFWAHLARAIAQDTGPPLTLASLSLYAVSHAQITETDPVYAKG